MLQLLASVFSYLVRDGAAGSAVGVLATSWLALGLVHVFSGRARPIGAVGLMLVAAGGVLALSAIAVSVVKPLPGFVFWRRLARFRLAGVYDLTAQSTWQQAAGVVGLVVTGLAAYCVLAFELEGQKHTIAPQVDGVVHEAGRMDRTT